MIEKNTSLPKILVGCPVSIYKDYIMLQWIGHIMSLTYKNYDILLVDNSPDPTYADKLRSYGVDVIYVDPKGREDRKYMAECNEIMRQYAVKNEYAALMSIECDQFPPRNIIEALMVYNYPVVSAPYCIGLGEKSKVLMEDACISEDKTFLKAMPLEPIKAFNRYTGEVVNTYANGIGCALIRGDVLEQVKFRVEDNDIGFADSFFYQDIFILGYQSKLDTSIITTHYNYDWNKIYGYKHNTKN